MENNRDTLDRDAYDFVHGHKVRKSMNEINVVCWYKANDSHVKEKVGTKSGHLIMILNRWFMTSTALMVNKM